MTHGRAIIKNRLYLFVTKELPHLTPWKKTKLWYILDNEEKLRMPSVVTLKMREYKVNFIISYCGSNVWRKATNV